ncbi:MAG TPA: HD domain-containing protein, partial [Chthoniobacterales bacterium]|nr:HD domain-containing protein [Chthoniobacterales bacterium]
MKTNVYELRDPIHNFIHFDPDERRVINSRPLQRLRYIHQLALTYLIYPGATHRRFEHSLGVMELAGRVFDVITHPENITDQVRRIFPEITGQDFLRYWRKVLRIAALLHDVGHPPFSHAAEKELFPAGFNHEDMTRLLISSREMRDLLSNLTPPVRFEDVVKIAIGPKKLRTTVFSDWEAVLAEIVTGDSFGVDRMDYLLRDSHHAGVAYGR